MFQTTQWSNVPLGASGSSITSARLFASLGVPSIVRGGLVSSPSQLYFFGIGLLCWKEGLLTANSFIKCLKKQMVFVLNKVGELYLCDNVLSLKWAKNGVFPTWICSFHFSILSLCRSM